MGDFLGLVSAFFIFPKRASIGVITHYFSRPVA